MRVGRAAKLQSKLALWLSGVLRQSPNYPCVLAISGCQPFVSANARQVTADFGVTLHRSRNVLPYTTKNKVPVIFQNMALIQPQRRPYGRRYGAAEDPQWELKPF